MSDNYWLGKSNWSATRLRLQHELTQTILHRQLIDPSIAVNSDAGPVADIAAGTAIWALEFAERYPSITVECLDANLDAIPPQSWLPSNVTSRQFDLLQDIPDDLVGRYQIIHIQYIMAFVVDSNVDKVVQSLLKMLKPGGYLQWTETNINHYSWVTGTGEVPVETHRLFETLRKFVAQRRDSRVWLNDFEGLLHRAGFQDLVYSAPEPRASTLQPVMMNWIWGIEEGFGYLVTRSLPSEMKTLVEQMLEQRKKAVEEADGLKVGMDMRVQRCVGRKPKV